MKKNKEKKKEENVVIKHDVSHRFVKKFTPEEIEEKNKNLSDLLMEKFKYGQSILQAKESIKSADSKLNEISREIARGGETVWEDCEVRAYRDTNIKEYYFQGELVDTEEADEDDFQLEIDQEEEEQEED